MLNQLYLIMTVLFQQLSKNFVRCYLSCFEISVSLFREVMKCDVIVLREARLITNVLKQNVHENIVPI
jgi:hypothetical protein